MAAWRVPCELDLNCDYTRLGIWVNIIMLGNRKVLRTFDKHAAENQKTIGSSQNTGDYYSRRVFTELADNDDELEIEKAMKRYGFNFKREIFQPVEEDKPFLKKDPKKFCSASREKNNLFSASKDRKKNIMTSSKNIHTGSGFFRDEIVKRKDPKIMVTEGSVKGVRSKQKTNKKSKDDKFSYFQNKKPSTGSIKPQKVKNWRERGSTNCDTVFQEKATKTQTTDNGGDSTSNDLEILQKVGQGTFGQVYMARLADGKLVAVKKVFQDRKYKNRELEILQMLNNDFVLNVLFTYHTVEKNDGEEKQYLNVVMEYYEHNLYQLVTEQKKPLSEIQIKIYMYQLFRGLAYIHSLDICHRDIKPPNILVHRSNKKLVICDFGSAKKLIKGESNIAYICSRCYRAPELIFGCTNYTTMVDVWSAGCVLLELIKGEPFFIGESNLDQLVEIIKVMGTPSKTEVVNMNPCYDLDDYKFPKVKKRQWKNIFPKASANLISFIQQIMIYSPKQRLNACQALAHEYFDDLRDQNNYRDLQTRWNIPGLFQFSKDQIKNNEHLIPKLVPTWYRRKGPIRM